MVEAAHFYRDLLGFDVVSASPEVETREGRFSHWIWLRRGGAEVMLNTAYDSGERPADRNEQRWSGHADVCLYLGCNDVDAAWADLKTRGLSPEPPSIAPYGLKRFTVRDPDGYDLCFQGPA